MDVYEVIVRLTDPEGRPPRGCAEFSTYNMVAKDGEDAIKKVKSRTKNSSFKYRVQSCTQVYRNVIV